MKKVIVLVLFNCFMICGISFANEVPKNPCGVDDSAYACEFMGVYLQQIINEMTRAKRNPDTDLEIKGFDINNRINDTNYHCIEIVYGSLLKRTGYLYSAWELSCSMELKNVRYDSESGIYLFTAK